MPTPRCICGPVSRREAAAEAWRRGGLYAHGESRGADSARTRRSGNHPHPLSTPHTLRSIVTAGVTQQARSVTRSINYARIVTESASPSICPSHPRAPPSKKKSGTPCGTSPMAKRGATANSRRASVSRGIARSRRSKRPQSNMCPHRQLARRWLSSAAIAIADQGVLCIQRHHTRHTRCMCCS